MIDGEGEEDGDAEPDLLPAVGWEEEDEQDDTGEQGAREDQVEGEIQGLPREEEVELDGVEWDIPSEDFRLWLPLTV